jgi:hypothetical protein
VSNAFAIATRLIRPHARSGQGRHAPDVARRSGWVFSTIRFSVASPWQRAQRSTSIEAPMLLELAWPDVGPGMRLHALDGLLELHGLECRTAAPSRAQCDSRCSSG